MWESQQISLKRHCRPQAILHEISCRFPSWDTRQKRAERASYTVIQCTKSSACSALQYNTTYQLPKPQSSRSKTSLTLSVVRVLSHEKPLLSFCKKSNFDHLWQAFPTPDPTTFLRLYADASKDPNGGTCTDVMGNFLTVPGGTT